MLCAFHLKWAVLNKMCLCRDCINAAANPEEYVQGIMYEGEWQHSIERAINTLATPDPILQKQLERLPVRPVLGFMARNSIGRLRVDGPRPYVVWFKYIIKNHTVRAFGWLIEGSRIDHIGTIDPQRYIRTIEDLTIIDSPDPDSQHAAETFLRMVRDQV